MGNGPICPYQQQPRLLTPPNYVPWGPWPNDPTLWEKGTTPGVDSSFKTFMTYMNHYEIKLPIYEKFIERIKMYMY